MRAKRGRKRGQRRAWWFERGVRLYYGDPHCIMCVVDWLGKPGPRWVRVPLHPPEGVDHWGLAEETAVMLSKADFIGKVSGTGPTTLVDPKFQKPYPTLWMYLSQVTWDDGSPRAPSGLTVFVQDGLFKGLLKENEQSLCLWVAGSSFFGVLDALEAALNVPQPDWRVDRRAGGGVAKKPRK